MIKPADRADTGNPSRAGDTRVGIGSRPPARRAWLVALVATLIGLGALLNLGPSAAAAAGGSPAAQPRIAGPGNGYWLVASDGGIFSFGGSQFYGSTGGMKLNKPIVGMAKTPDALGYWLVASDGGIFNYGDASFFGSTGAMKLNQPIVGMAVTPTGLGYWLVASDGGIFSFGDAKFFGSTGGMKLNLPIVGMAVTPTGLGYWLVASDGGIFSYGDAKFFGSTGAMKLNQPIVGMAAEPDGSGYWLVASDGGIFSYGDSPFYGSTGGMKLNKPIVGMASSTDGNGYWLVASDGGIFNYGDAHFFGSTGAMTLNQPIVGMAAHPGIPASITLTMSSIQSTTIPANGTSQVGISVAGAPPGDTIHVTGVGSPSGACGVLSPSTETVGTGMVPFFFYTASTAPGTCAVIATESLQGQSAQLVITQQ